MVLCIEFEPALEAKLEEEARKLGISKSEFVKDALERALGIKNPADLLSQARSGTPMGNPQASADIKSSVREKISAKHNR